MGQVTSLDHIVDGNSRVLILGSMPGEESLRLRQYYANRANQFWELVYSLFGYTPDKEYGQRIVFVKRHGIALWDVLACCVRNGSLDSDIRNGEPNDIAGLLCRFPGIRVVALNGSEAERQFNKHVRGLISSQIPVLPLPSSSSTPGRHVLSLDEKKAEWSVLRRHLLSPSNEGTGHI